MEIVEYQPQYRQAFVDLNTTWVEKYFVMEEADREQFAHIDEDIERGAMILFAMEDGQVLATCMVLPAEDGVWELCKLACDERYAGRGAGSAVFKACMDYAIERGAKKLVLVSNSALKTALHIYEKLGFRQVPVDRAGGYARADVQCEYRVEQAG